MTTQARIDANRKNAQKSTGPRTAEGKERSRLNGLKHGLRSEEIVLPTEDRSQFESHLAAWMDDWKPPTETRRFLVERVASAAWKLRRCMRNENQRLTDRVQKAAAEWDTQRGERADRLARKIPVYPGAMVGELMKTPRGVDRLIGLWSDLRDALAEPGAWCHDLQHDMLCHLCGITRASTDPALVEISDLSDSLMALTEGHDPEEAQRLSGLLLLTCRSALARLDAYRETLPSEDDCEARRIYAEMKSLEPTPEDAIHHRYEGRLDREVRATINQLMTLQKTGLDLMAGEESEAPSEPIASEAPSEPNATAPEPAPKPKAPSEPNAVPGQGLITKVNRDSIGVFPAVGGGVDVPVSLGNLLLNR